MNNGTLQLESCRIPSRTSDSHEPNLLMPAYVEPDQVLDLVERISAFKPSASLFDLSKCMNICNSLPILRAAELLQLLAVSGNGTVSLTRAGLELNQLAWRRGLLREKLSFLEPFRTALILAGVGNTSIEEITKALDRRGVRWHEIDRTNMRIVHSLLVNWAVSCDLLAYDGRCQEFSLLTERNGKVPLIIA